MGARPWQPRGSCSMTASARLPRASSGSKKGGLATGLSRVKSLLERGLAATASLWPDVRGGYSWVSQAAHILGNEEQREATTVKHR